MRNIDRKFRSRRHLLALSTALATCSALAAPALAQIADSQPTPPREYNVDANGIDLVSGQYYLPVTDLRVGSEDAELTFSRMMRNGGYESPYDTALNIVASEYDVIIGSVTDNFTSAANGLSTTGSGARLTTPSSGTYHYTTRDGVVYVFLASNWSSRVRVAQHRASNIIYPDGRMITIQYEINSSPSYHLTRPSAIYSNDGYRISFTYQGNSLGGSDPLRWSRWMTLASATGSNSTTGFCAGACVGGRTVTYAWTPDNLQETRTDAAGRGLITSFNSSGQIVAVKPIGAGANRINLTYTAGRVTALQTPSGTWQYAYSAVDNPASGSATRTVTVTSPTGLQRVVTIRHYQNKIIADRTGTGGTTSFEYDANRRLSRMVEPEGNATVYQYDSRDNILSKSFVAKDGVTTQVTSATYPVTCTDMRTCNKPTSTTDRRGLVTDYVYDTTHGQVTSIKRPSPDGGSVRPETRFAYSPRQTNFYWASGSTFTGGAIYKLSSVSECASGQAPACVGTAAEMRLDVAFPPSATMNNPLPTSITARAGDNSVSVTQGYTYTGFGQTATIDGPLAGTGDTTTNSYDAAGLLTETRAPDPDGAAARGSLATRTVRDGEGRVTEVQAGYYPNGNTSPGAFVLGETRKTDYDATTALKAADALVVGGTTIQRTQYAYDADARLTCETQRMNAAAFTATANACALGPEGSDGPDRIRKIDFDSAGRIGQATDGYGTAAASVEALTYTANGRVATATDGENNRTTYEYDGFDRTLKTRFPVPTKGALTSSTTDYEQFGYNAAGNVTSQIRRDGTAIAYSYDNLGRRTFKDMPGTADDVTYSYDLLDRATGATRNGAALSFAHNALGQVTSQTQPLGTTSYSYDAAGRRLSMTYPGGGLTINYDYDANGNVTRVRENGATSGVGVLADYAFDDLGRRSSVTFGNGSVQSFAYDSAARLGTLTNNLGGAATTHDLTQSFAYNPARQLTGVTRSNDAYAWGAHYNVDRAYLADGLNRITSAGGGALGYDTRGNLTSAGGVGYGYDADNLMTSGPGGAALGYDALGRLKSVSATATPTPTLFAYEGPDRIAEYQGASSITARYVHGPGVDNPIVWYNGNTIDNVTRRFLMADERGSIVSVTDSAGATVAINSYDEYGIPASGNAGKFGYTGQAWLPEIGMWYYKARMYSPTLGRFMQTDPIGYEDGMNWYNYVGSDPVNSSDPTGLCDGDGTGCPDIVVTGTRLVGGGLGGGGGGGGGGGSMNSLVGLMDNMSAAMAAAAAAAAKEDKEETIVVTGKRYRKVAAFVNTDGSFKCNFVGGRNVVVKFSNNGVIDRVDAKLTSYPAFDNGNAIPQWTNPGPSPFFQSKSSHIFYFGKIDLAFSARASSANGLYNHNLTGRGNEGAVNDVGTSINVTIYTDGGSGGCR